MSVVARPKFLRKNSFFAYFWLLMMPFVLFNCSVKDELPEHPVLMDIVVSMIPWMLLIYCYRRARRHAMLPAKAILIQDDRNSVLYLGSFEDDDIRMWARSTNGRIFWERMITFSFEEMVTDHLWQYGPVVVIGDAASDDSIPLLGAPRHYMKQGTWQQKAKN